MVQGGRGLRREDRTREGGEVTRDSRAVTAGSIFPHGMTAQDLWISYPSQESPVTFLIILRVRPGRVAIAPTGHISWQQ